MLDGNIVMTVSGQFSGEYSLTRYIREILHEKGFDVVFDGGFNFENVEEYEKHFNQNGYEETIEDIKKEITIIMNVQQLPRTIKGIDNILGSGYSTLKNDEK